MIRLVSYFFILLLYVFSFLVNANENEDRSYEDRLHRIYLKNYKNPVTNDEWSELIGFLKKSYQLQHKDNFWDLSKTFFKDNLYWSKLWVANPLVENPHRIYKGDSLKFDIKTLSAVNTSEYSTPVSEQFPGVEIPPQLYKRQSLREYEMPSSLPFIKENISLEPVSSKISLSLNLIEINKKALLPFYLSDEKPLKLGEVIGKDGYGFLSLNGENIIVQIRGDVSIGGKYTVVKNRGSLNSSFFNLLKTNSYEIQIKGEIKILGYISGTESMYRAQVTKSLEGIAEGDSILAGARPVFTLSQKGSYGTANGIIIGSPNKKMKMLSLYSIVYLGKGESHGVRVGDLYYIKAKSAHSFKKHNKRTYEYKKPSIGQLRVIHTNPDVSTAIIIQAKDQIYLNDFFSSSLDSVSDLGQSESHESIDSSKDSYNLEEVEEDENLEEVEEDENLEEMEEDENLEEVEEDENLEEVEEDENLEEVEEDENLEEMEEDESDENNDMENIKDEFEDLEELEEIEDSF